MAASNYRSFIAQLKKKRPTSVPLGFTPDNWAQLQAYWEDESTKAESSRNKNNRASGQSVNYYGGNRSSRTHSKNLVSLILFLF